MSDYPGCDCGHPHAEPSWIDHGYPCAYVDAAIAGTVDDSVAATQGPK